MYILYMQTLSDFAEHGVADLHVRRLPQESIFIERITSHRKLMASREGSNTAQSKPGLWNHSSGVL